MAHDIFGVLAEQAGCYEELIEIGEAKRDVLVKNDALSLKKINFKEEEIICRYKRCERLRLKAIEDWAEEDGAPPGSITLDWLIEKCGDPQSRSRLLSVKERMRAAAQALKEVNSLNMKLIKGNLDYIECSVNLMRSAIGDRRLLDARS
jgi:hypothetical protein